MSDHSRPSIIRRTDVVTRVEGEEVLVLDLRSNTAHCLSGDLARVWAATGSSVTGVAAEAGLTDDAVDTALGTLRELDLIASRSGIGRRALVRSAAFGGAVVATGAVSIPLPASAAAASATFTVSRSCATTQGVAAGATTYYPATLAIAWSGQKLTPGAQYVVTVTWRNAADVQQAATFTATTAADGAGFTSVGTATSGTATLVDASEIDYLTGDAFKSGGAVQIGIQAVSGSYTDPGDYHSVDISGLAACSGPTPTSTTISLTSAGTYFITVPAGVAVEYSLVGGGGAGGWNWGDGYDAGSGGNGAVVSGTTTNTTSSTQTIAVTVAGGGRAADPFNEITGAGGSGYQAAGSGGAAGWTYGGGGGGSSALFSGATSGDVLMVAGGGGGGGGNHLVQVHPAPDAADGAAGNTGAHGGVEAGRGDSTGAGGGGGGGYSASTNGTGGSPAAPVGNGGGGGANLPVPTVSGWAITVTGNPDTQSLVGTAGAGASGLYNGSGLGESGKAGGAIFKGLGIAQTS